MARIAILILVLVVLPFAIWLFWQAARGRRQFDSIRGVLRAVVEGPWPWLMAASAALVIGALLVFSELEGEEPGGTYVAPHLEDGRIVPGRTERPPP